MKRRTNCRIKRGDRIVWNPKGGFHCWNDDARISEWRWWFWHEGWVELQRRMRRGNPERPSRWWARGNWNRLNVEAWQ